MSHHQTEPNGESTIPMWVYLTGVGLFLFTLICFGILVAGNVFL